MQHRILTSILAIVAIATCISFAAAAQAVDAEEARAIAKQAWLYAYAPIRSYRMMYNQAVNKDSADYTGGFNRIGSRMRVYTPSDTEIVMPSNDTEESWAWLDLRAEPVVFSVPPVPPPRYYVNQWFDMWTFDVGYTGVRTTGRNAGNFLFVGPNWKGEVPAGIDKVFRAETEFVGTLTRTELLGPRDVDALKALQAQYKLAPLSQFLGKPAAKPAAPVEWPAWDAQRAEGIDFIGYMNALLRFMPLIPSEAAMRARFATIGMEAGKPFDADKLDPALREAIEQGIFDAVRELQVKSRATRDATDLYGTRESLGAGYVMSRALGAMAGLYGTTPEEMTYETLFAGPDGKWLTGAKNWVLHFGPGELPPVKYFWSLTMYDVPGQHLVANSINRYSIGSRTPELKYRPDGSLDLYLQDEHPGKDKESNWLPTPNGPFFMRLRMYGPEQAVLTRKWHEPPLMPVN